ncbi:hypothetical protein VPH35_076343 [Triticum aestivum]|uniref:Uncharacterized protein n=1 Tax=Triticum aestivum TaxID=4565 RepID=A0A3B6JD19_WHEAT
MVAISMYRGNLHRGGDDAARRWPVPPPTLSASQFRRLLHRRSLAVSRLAGAPRPNSPNPRPGDGAAGPVAVGEAQEVDGGQQQQQHQAERQEEEGHAVQMQQQHHQVEEEGQGVQQPQGEGEGQDEQQQQGDEGGEEGEQEEGAVEDVEMDDAGEVVAGDADAGGNGDPEEGQGESEGFDPNSEVG